MYGELIDSGATELSAAFLQAAITVGLVAICLYLYGKYRKPYFAWWAVAWLLYVLRLGAIISFMTTGDEYWLYWHQVTTGWTALALLWSALVFSRGIQLRPVYLIAVLFPPIWSYVAIYRMDNFLLAAGPAVLFLSLATLWTGVVLFRFHRQVGSFPAAVMAISFFLWSLHHLDYPFLRARGAWNPWGYYLDIVFELAIGAGILLLVIEDQKRGLEVLSSLSGDLQGGGSEEDVLAAVLARPLTFPAVSGSAMYVHTEDGGRFTHGTGVCGSWVGGSPKGAAREAIDRVMAEGCPVVVRGGSVPQDGESGDSHAYRAALPVFRGSETFGAIVVIGSERDPFAALDDEFLIALGHQVGAALANADLYGRLQDRTEDLKRLAVRMVEQHEEERLHLSRELHDETAQVFAAVRLQIGLASEEVSEGRRPYLDRALELTETGIRTIRRVASNLRPALLDDLGLLPALHALAAEFTARTPVKAYLRAPATLPELPAEAELALFRAMQEGLVNVVRHSDASAVTVDLGVESGEVVLRIRDDGHGAASGERNHGGDGTGIGLIGMRERIISLGGDVSLRSANGGGMELQVTIPHKQETEPA